MRVSVIIPTHNYGRFLRAAIESVQAQTVSDLEIIVVDDASSDNTSEILASIADPRMRVFRLETSQGVSVARNTGIEHARGEYIAFLDADDLWVPEKLELQLALIEENPEVNFVFANAMRFGPCGELPYTVFDYCPELASLGKRTALGGRGWVIEDSAFALTKVRYLPTWIQTVLIRRSAVEDLRFAAGMRIAEDRHYVIRVYERVTAGYIQAPLTRIRRHGANSFENPADSMIPTVHALIDLEGRVRRENRPVLRTSIGSAWAGLGHHHFHNGNEAKCLSAYARALAYPGARLTALIHLTSIWLPRRLRNALANRKRGVGQAATVAGAND